MRLIGLVLIFRVSDFESTLEISIDSICHVELIHLFTKTQISRNDKQF